MLTAHQIKILHSLDQKKFRQKHRLFVVEGNKNIVEIQHSGYKIKDLFSIKPQELAFLNIETTEISLKELKVISFLQNPKDSLAVCELPENKLLEQNSIQLLLDGIQDPGNLGTLIRLADWFGIEQVICSEDTVDLYNPKVIQATMGSFTRVNVVYANLTKVIKDSHYPVYGTAMEGENIYAAAFPERFSLVLGNEGNGVRPETFKMMSKNLTIPRFGKNQTTESLNVATAAAIVLGQIYAQK